MDQQYKTLNHQIAKEKYRKDVARYLIWTKISWITFQKYKQ